MLPASLLADLDILSRQEGASLFMTTLAAAQTLLFRITGQDDVVVGSPVANRNRVEIEPLIGFFVNTLVLRTVLDETVAPLDDPDEDDAADREPGSPVTTESAKVCRGATRV